jgi:acyl carrier protein
MADPLPPRDIVEATLDYVRSLHTAHANLGELSAGTPLLTLGVAGAWLDSLQLLGLVSHLEARYGVSLGLDELVPENFETPQAVARLIVAHLSPR